MNTPKTIYTALLFILVCHLSYSQNDLKINEKDYFETNGLNVMVFTDNYAEGHQGGIIIIQHENRVATNGDLRLEPAPGQWQPIPKLIDRKVDKENNIITATLAYPDSNMISRNFNPIIYPDLYFQYQLKVKAEGQSVRITVDLEKPLPEKWVGMVGFNLELFPGALFDKTFFMDGKPGLFHRQLNGPMATDVDGSLQVKPMAEGHKLVIAPGADTQRMTITSSKNTIQLIDGRSHHNNGWFVARSLVPAGATKNAIEWVISPNVIPDWTYKPVVQVSQVGYFTNQTKTAIIECKSYDENQKVILKKLQPSGEFKTVLEKKPAHWGTFKRYEYLTFDFTSAHEPGTYRVEFGESRSSLFKIGDDILNRNVWQPTLEYFLPVQMCHMRINDRYRVWHGLCHMDDALMAPTDTVHIDGYWSGASTLTKYEPYDQVPGLNVGGWHDAGDYDLRVESQAGTSRILSLIYENFKAEYDQTLIDQENRRVEIHVPDGKQDVLQQIEHGVLTILAGYENLGRLYRGIIAPTVRQYVLLGDASVMTDNISYKQGSDMEADDRWVFTEINPGRELYVSGCLAAASRALKGYNDQLAAKCLKVAEELWAGNRNAEKLASQKVEALVELILATGDQQYKEQLVALEDHIRDNFYGLAWTVVRVLGTIENKKFVKNIEELQEPYYAELARLMSENPYQLPYRPQIWGVGWNIQRFGVEQYFLYKHWENEHSKEYMMNALNFVLGCHPGSNNISFVSGVGTKSTIVAYGVNRADWSYIPGGVVSGTSYIQPDFPEFKVWPFFWQQGEYVMGGGATNFMFLALAAKEVFTE